MGKLSSVPLVKDEKVLLDINPIIIPPFDRNNCYKIAIDQGDYGGYRAYNNTLAIDENGDVYSDTNKNAALGEFTRLNFPHKAISVATSAKHSLILTQSGTVYSFGWGKRGNLGHGNLEDLSVPTCIDALKKYKISKIFASDAVSACISKGGKLFFFGAKCKGQGYNGLEVDNVSTPTLIKLDKDKADCIALGHGLAFLALTKKGQLYKWGELNLDLWKKENAKKDYYSDEYKILFKDPMIVDKLQKK